MSDVIPRDFDSTAVLRGALEDLNALSGEATDGTWLEQVTARVAPFLRDWDLSVCYPWSAWPEREEVFPNSTAQDIGIDLVARRRSDDELVAIQCKARKLGTDNAGADIARNELTSFISASASEQFAARWVVTNGANRLSSKIKQQDAISGKPLTVVNVAADLKGQLAVRDSSAHPRECAHCDDPESGRQTRDCMQDEAVRKCVDLLREQAETSTGGRGVGEARGRLILPCGSGKTRVALRVVEELTGRGQVSIVLCPSIALVAQLRREFLRFARPETNLRVMAVCSDQTAGYSPSKEGAVARASDPTADNSNVSAHEVKGLVTTDQEVIARWISDGGGGDSHLREATSVIFGTYQSAGRVAEALNSCDSDVAVLVCDEAHRTASLKRRSKDDEQRRLREFTLCHDQEAFPARYRLYQTATPRIYAASSAATDILGIDKTDWVVRSMDDESVFGVELYRRSYQDAVRHGWLADYRIIALGVNDPKSFAAANELARAAGTGRNRPSTADYLRGLSLVLALGGGTRTPASADAQGAQSGGDGSDTASGDPMNGADGDVAIESCITFLNTVAKSKTMAADLQSEPVRAWLAERLAGRSAAAYSLSHVDATANVAEREQAKVRLAEADADNPHAVFNVGIFGEGTDSPSLSAVAFLEPRRSPIDVVQAVGRAMRTAAGKDCGYIICPILFPNGQDPEEFLAQSKPDEGWSELGQILLALRAHDSRIEDNLAEMIQIHVPAPAADAQTQDNAIVAVASPERDGIEFAQYRGPVDAVLDIVEDAAARGEPLTEYDGMTPLDSEHWAESDEPFKIVTATLIGTNPDCS